MTKNENITSGVLTTPADAMPSKAVAETLKALAGKRAKLFEQFVKEIERYMRCANISIGKAVSHSISGNG